MTDILTPIPNRLVHSPLLPEILIKEKTYAKSISEMIARMDKEIESLNDRQAVEMENKIEQLDVSTTSEVIQFTPFSAKKNLLPNFSLM